MEAQESEGAVAQVETETTWREALSALLRPSDHHVSDEEIFAILNGGTDGVTSAELCVARGVTMPMYCLWKSKYRQLDLEQLSAARRHEQRRRQTVNGLLLLTAVLLTGGIAVSVAWGVSSTFKVMAESTLSIPPTPERKQSPVSASGDSSPVRAPAREAAAVEPRSAAVEPRSKATAVQPSEATPTIVETGYRIQVRAAESAAEGRAMVARLTSKGYSAYMTRAVVGNSDVFRVRVGPFDTHSAAAAIASRLRSDGFGDVWISR